MLIQSIKYYIASFAGFRREVWILALVSLVNRAGTMVIPFLSLYLTNDVSFTYAQVGWVMSAFGIGSLMGSYLGGKLTDFIGYYPTMVMSVLLSAVLFVVLQYVKSFQFFCLSIALLMTVADTFRPALFVSLKSYSKPENRTRSVTLIRLAINLGFSVGPAAGGFIIANMGYGGLFWIDGITCFLAGLMLLGLLSNKQSKADLDDSKLQSTGKRSPYADKLYMIFLGVVVLVGISFLQFFSTVPLYYRDVHQLSEQSIGLLLGLNGALIFIIEMPLIKWLEDSKWSIMKVLIISIFLFASSFFLMNMTSWSGVLVIGMFLMTFGEMLNFPYGNRFAMDRAEKGKMGAFMGAYTIAFSIAHVVGHNAGLQMVSRIGFEATWYIITGLLVIGMAIMLYLKTLLKKEEISSE
jgi:predicted MFS family arabinose efflux permease